MKTTNDNLQEKIKEILEAYGNYVYYEGDPKRGGKSLEKSIEELTALIESEKIMAKEEGKQEARDELVYNIQLEKKAYAREVINKLIRILYEDGYAEEYLKHSSEGKV